jgi:TatD DNase family protein
VTRLPALDLHAHVDVGLDAIELRDLHAVVFAVTRSLAEARQAVERSDDTVVWGVGCHPGLVRAQRSFSTGEFAELLQRTAFAAELGLDGSSRVPMETQRATLQSALGVLRQVPRIVSLHTYKASAALIEDLTDRPIKGAILHWWLGDEELTKQAVALGCFFSVNASSVRQRDVLWSIPPERILTETDHPFGDRWSPPPRRPGAMTSVEEELAKHLHVTPEEVRRRVWANFAELVRSVGCGGLLPRSVRAQLAALPTDFDGR